MSGSGGRCGPCLFGLYSLIGFLVCEMLDAEGVPLGDTVMCVIDDLIAVLAFHEGNAIF